MFVLTGTCDTWCHKTGSYSYRGDVGLPLSHSEVWGLFSPLPCLSVSHLTPSATSSINEVDFKLIVLVRKLR